MTVRTTNMALGLVGILIGCKAERVPMKSPADFIDDEPAVGFEVVSSQGEAPHTVVVRAVNLWGAAVASGDAELTVDGERVSVSFDSLGYGGIRLIDEGVHEITGGDAPATATVLDPTTWTGLGMNPLIPAPTTSGLHSGSLTNGMVVATEDEVWFAEPQGNAHRVLSLPRDIVGMQTTHVDVDGLLDVAVWTQTTLYLLKGRVGGGVAWGSALEAQGYDIGGATVGDFNGDNLPDIAVAWNKKDEHLFDVWHGDGLLNFEPVEPRSLPESSTSVALGDNTGEGRQQATVFHNDGTWTRFLEGSPGLYIPIGPRTPSQFGFNRNSTLMPGVDLNGDEADELLVLAPRIEGQPRALDAIELDRAIRYVPVKYTGAFATAGDGNSDGIGDLFFLQDDLELKAVHYDREERAYKPRTFGSAPAYAPIAVADFVHDTVPDTFIPGDTWWWWFAGADAVVVETPFYEMVDPNFFDWATNIQGEMISFLELDEDPFTQELVVLDGVDQPDLKILSAPVDNVGVAQELGSIELANTATAAVLCDDVNVLALTLDNGLERYHVGDPNNMVFARNLEIVADIVVCGQGPDDTTSATLNTATGEVNLITPSLEISSTFNVAGAKGIAMGDLGDGPTVRTCNTLGCDIEFWEYEPGKGAFAITDASGLSIDDGTTVELVGSITGALSIGDIDGSGGDEAIVVSTDGTRSFVTVYRGVHGAVERYHTMMPISSDIWLRDNNEDGYPELWMYTDEGDITYTSTPWVPPVEEETDTGDTGLDSADTGGSDTAEDDTAVDDSGDTDTAGDSSTDTAGSGPPPTDTNASADTGDSG